MKKKILTEAEQTKRIQELMGRLDNNDFDTVKVTNKKGYGGDIDEPLTNPEISYDDRDVEPDFFGSDDVEGGFDSYYDEPEDNEYVADFSSDMTMGRDLDYGDKGFDREDEYKYDINDPEQRVTLIVDLKSDGINKNDIDKNLFSWLNKNNILHTRGNENKYITRTDFNIVDTYIDKYLNGGEIDPETLKGKPQDIRVHKDNSRATPDLISKLKQEDDKLVKKIKKEKTRYSDFNYDDDNVKDEIFEKLLSGQKKFNKVKPQNISKELLGMVRNYDIQSDEFMLRFDTPWIYGEKGIRTDLLFYLLKTGKLKNVYGDKGIFRVPFMRKIIGKTGDGFFKLKPNFDYDKFRNYIKKNVKRNEVSNDVDYEAYKEMLNKQ